MAIARALASNNDLQYTAGRQGMLNDADKVQAQAVRVCIQHIEGENIFFPRLGIPISAIASSSPSEQAAAIRKALERSRRLQSILEVTYMGPPGKDRRHAFLVRALLTNGRSISLGVNLGG